MKRPALAFARIVIAVTGLAECGVLAASGAPPAGPVTLPLDPAASSLSFTIHRPGQSIDGTAGTFEGEVSLDPSDLTQGATVALRVTAASLQTGNRIRDGKMRKSHLDVDRFPSIVFRSRSIQLGPDKPRGVPGGGAPPAGGSAARKALVEGTLGLHGVERGLLVPASIRYDNGILTAEGSVTLTYSDYGIPIPRFLWLVMDDAIVVRFRFVAGPAAP